MPKLSQQNSGVISGEQGEPSESLMMERNERMVDDTEVF
jgi:hypothetical protein